MSSGNASKQEDLPKTKDVVTGVFGAVKEYSRLASQIPNEDYEYHEAFPDFTKCVQAHSATLIEVMGLCAELIPKRRRTSLQPTVNGSGMPELSETQRTAAMEAIDSLLESVDSVLDEMKGRKLDASEQLAVTFGSEIGGDQRKADDDNLRSTTALGGRGGAGVRRPQLTFENPVDNSDKPFVPIYYDAKGVRHVGTAHVHPFEDTIKAFQPPASQLLPHSDTPYQPLATCPLRFVDTVADLEETAKELLQEKEIAVDLEHHDFYSYQGFTCLMQISSRTVDYIVDCLQLRSSMHLLAPVFLNPNTLKVFHGAREDVRWLQKDFGLYLVNFFDTGLALQTLHMPYSLAFAVDHFCQVKLNKKYQTADWRVRPMSAEMVNYARQDTHYLLYVYDRLKSLLLNSESRASMGNLLVHVFSESKALSLELYEKHVLDPEQSYKHALGRSLGGLRPVQDAVAKVVFNWRDAAAREVDDSPTAVMHLSSVLAIASKLPTSSRELLRCCSPVSVVLRQHVGSLLELVRGVVGVSADADGGAGDASNRPADLHAGESTSTDTTMELLRRRQGGIYRPMTGSLPSVGSVTHVVGGLVTHGERKRLREAETDESCTHGGLQLRTGTASSWLLAMKTLASTLAKRPVLAVALPGSDLMESFHAAALAKSQATPESPEEAAGAPPSAVKSNSDSEDDQAVEAPHKEEETPNFTALLPKESKPIKEEEGAIALRDKYGVGAKNRRANKNRGAGSKDKK